MNKDLSPTSFIVKAINYVMWTSNIKIKCNAAQKRLVILSSPEIGFAVVNPEQLRH